MPPSDEIESRLSSLERIVQDLRNGHGTMTNSLTVINQHLLRQDEDAKNKNAALERIEVAIIGDMANPGANPGINGRLARIEGKAASAASAVKTAEKRSFANLYWPLIVSAIVGALAAWFLAMFHR